ncbi:MAG: TonB-dependent receptor [Opitutales bacterium]|nr:TonB-dependent receptor [Opitutales bacterium]
MPRPLIKQLFLVFAAALPVLPPLAGQADDPPDEGVHILDTLVVDARDQRGYVASTSMSGTRLAQLVRDLPIPIDIITEDFIRDTGALTVREALQYSAGLEVAEDFANLAPGQSTLMSQQAGENPSPTGTSFRLRGFVTQAVLRNGFRREGSSDTINVVQVDVVRGPNALLYGIGNFGGVVNYVTRQPYDEYGASLRVSVGSHAFYRAQVDVTGPITEDLYFRLPLMYQDRENWFDHFRERRRGIAPVITYRIGTRTRVQLEFDYYETERTLPENPLSQNLRSQVTLPFIDGTHHPVNLGFLDYPDRSFRYTGPDTYNNQEDLGALAQVTHAFTDQLALNVGYYWSRTRVRQLHSGLNLRPIADMLSPTLTGETNRARYPWAYVRAHERYDEWSAEEFYALQYNWSRSERRRWRNQARGELVYKPELFGLNHTFMSGYTYDRLEQSILPWSLKDRTRDPTSLETNDFTGLQGSRPRYQSIHNRAPIRFSLFPGEEFMLTADPVKSFIGEAHGAYLIYQSAFFNERLRTVGGLRYDRFQILRETRYNAAESNEAVGDLSLIGRKKPFKTRQNPTSQWNYSLGVSLTATDALSVFALTASALDPETTGGQRTPEGFVADPQSGQSYELGIKADWLEGKISGSFSIYRINRENVAVSPHPGTRADSGERILPPSGIHNPGSTAFDPDWIASGRDAPGSSALREDRSEGIDTQIFLIGLVPNFETILSFSYNRYSIRDAVFFLYEGKQDGEFVFERVKARAFNEETGTSLPWDDSRLNNDTPKYSFRIWNKYTFRDNALDGFNIAVGVRWSDRREASFGFADNPSYKIIPDRTSVDLAFGYAINVRDLEIDLRVNVYNLLDDDKVYGYVHTEPRNWRMSASVRF